MAIGTLQYFENIHENLVILNSNHREKTLHHSPVFLRVITMIRFISCNQIFSMSVRVCECARNDIGTGGRVSCNYKKRCLTSTRTAIAVIKTFVRAVHDEVKFQTLRRISHEVELSIKQISCK
jgi:hypothetical protein